MANKNRRKRKNNFLCIDCGADTSSLKEHYFVNTALWTGVGYTIYQQACCNCLMKRLGRKLEPSDFTDAYINDPKRNDMSDTLRKAILGQL